MKKKLTNIGLSLIVFLIVISGVSRVQAMALSPLDSKYEDTFSKEKEVFDSFVKSHFTDGHTDERTILNNVKYIIKPTITLFFPTDKLSEVELMQIVTFYTDLRVGIIAYDYWKNPNDESLSILSSVLRGESLEDEIDVDKKTKEDINQYFSSKPTITELLQRYEDMRYSKSLEEHERYSNSTEEQTAIDSSSSDSAMPKYKTDSFITFTRYAVFIIFFLIIASFLFVWIRIFRRKGIKSGLAIIGNKIEKGFGGAGILNNSSNNMIEELQAYKDYYVGFDTNVLLNDPEILADTSITNDILLSKQVFDELDKKKNDENLRANARRALAIIEDLHKDERLFIVTVDTPFLEANNLNPKSPDERIIGAYLKERNDKNVKVIFISADRGARVIARQVGLELLNIE